MISPIRSKSVILSAAAFDILFNNKQNIFSFATQFQERTLNLKKKNPRALSVTRCKHITVYTVYISYQRIHPRCLVVYTFIFLLSHRAWVFHRIEGKHPRGHLVTAAVLSTAIKETQPESAAPCSAVLTRLSDMCCVGTSGSSPTTECVILQLKLCVLSTLITKYTARLAFSALSKPQIYASLQLESNTIITS